jgi:Zn-dependent protease
LLSLEHTLLVLPGILVGFTVHEFAHAWVALRLGDDTAQQMGRFSLNPIRHIDLIGFILLLTAGFGWAKPVMIDLTKLRHPRRDDVLISIAGPFSNLALSIAGTALLAVLIVVLPYRGNQVLIWGLQALNAGIFVNLGLFVFNLIPIPPLDGSHVALQALNIRNPVNVRAFYKYGTILLLGIIVAERALNVDILPIGSAVRFLGSGLLELFGLGG